MFKPWQAHYQQGVAYEINPQEYTSIVDLFEQSCQQYARNVAYINLGTQLTYEALEKKSRQFAVYLQSLNLQKGDRVALMMPNILQYPVALLGTLRAGLIVVNTNPLYTADELAHQMQDSGAKVLVVMANFAHTVEKALPNMPALEHIVVTELGDLFPLPKRLLVNAIIKYVKHMVPHWHLPSFIRFNDCLSKPGNTPLQKPLLTHQDIAFLQYTGGTTGIAKGAVLTHGNMVCNVLQASSWISPLNIGENDFIVTALPLYHIFSLTANCLTFLKVGARNLLITNPRDIPAFIREIKKIQFTAITGVNTLFNALLNHPEFESVDFSKVKLALSGGMSLQKSVAMRWEKVCHTRLLEAYGLTETSPAVTINPMYLTTYNGSIGLPLPSTEIQIIDKEGNEVPLGTPGELCVKGPQVMHEYWHRPDETLQMFTPDGFLKTGDITTMDENGFIYLVDRKKDMIIVSGFNVYPNEIEQVISLHPGVLEVGVVGEAYEESGERVKACIVKRDPELTAEAIIAHCRKHLTAYKVPKIVAFYTELPKTNVGKILRRALKNY